MARAWRPAAADRQRAIQFRTPGSAKPSHKLELRRSRAEPFRGPADPPLTTRELSLGRSDASFIPGRPTIYFAIKFTGMGEGFEAIGNPIPGRPDSASRRPVSIFGLSIDQPQVSRFWMTGKSRSYPENGVLPGIVINRKSPSGNGGKSPATSREPRSRTSVVETALQSLHASVDYNSPCNGRPARR